MDQETHPEARGIAETQQAQIEARAMELARAAGREAINEYDLGTARREILGPGSEEATAPVDGPLPGEPQNEDEIPSD